MREKAAKEEPAEKPAVQQQPTQARSKAAAWAKKTNGLEQIQP